MRKRITAILICGVMIATIAGCGSSDDTSEEETTTEETATETASAEENKEAEEEDKVYSIGETWTVEGQWEFTIDSVSTTDERNESEDYDPVQVIVINYHYKNLGYVDETHRVDGLYMNLGTYTLVDGDGNVCNTYAAVLSDDPKETPIDATCTAQKAFGLMDDSRTATLTVDESDGSQMQTAKFDLSW